jgi:hypothetical protein
MNIEKTAMNKCKRSHPRVDQRNARNLTHPVNPGRNRLKSMGESKVRCPVRTSFLAPPAADSVESGGLFATKSGLDITRQMIELLWLSFGRNHLTFEEVRETFPGDKFTADDMALVCRVLEQAGVTIIEASAVKSFKSANRSSAHESVQRILERVAAQTYLRRMAGEPPPLQDVDTAPAPRMEDADREMRRIVCSFGFAAHQHIVRAEKLLACPSAERLEQVLAGSQISSRTQYLKALPNLIKQVRVLDQQAAAAYRAWREGPGETDGGKHLAEFRRLSHQLQQVLPGFCYQVTVIQQMIASAENFAVQFRAGQRVQGQFLQGRNPVYQLPLADVERQAVETMEEFVRMPCEAFLQNFDQLKTAEAKFQQARCQLIHDHLPLVGSLARTYPQESLPLPRLILAGILGLLGAVDKCDYRCASRFATYASGWIRQSMREVLSAQLRQEEEVAAKVAAT